MTDCRIIDDFAAGSDDLATLILSLPQWRREAALRYKFEKGRRECCLSYLLLCDILREKFNTTRQPFFETGEHGKPELSFDNDTVEGKASADGNGLRFNLSHCKRAIACIVSDSDEVGIDVECTGRYTVALAEYCMSDEEKQRIADADDPDMEFTLLWTKKEALLKLTGEGITDDLKTVLESTRMEGITLQSHYNKDKGYAWSVARKKREMTTTPTLRPVQTAGRRVRI